MPLLEQQVVKSHPHGRWNNKLINQRHHFMIVASNGFDDIVVDSNTATATPTTE